MIDDSDGDFALLAGMGGGPAVWLICLVLAIVFYCQSAENKVDCAKRNCPTGTVGRLLSHECMCVAVLK